MNPTKKSSRKMMDARHKGEVGQIRGFVMRPNEETGEPEYRMNRAEKAFRTHMKRALKTAGVRQEQKEQRKALQVAGRRRLRQERKATLREIRHRKGYV